MHPIFKLGFSLTLCLLTGTSFAQQKEKKPDSLKVKFYPRAFRVGTDVISLIKQWTPGSFSGWELNADVDCGKYYVAVDYGQWGRGYELMEGANGHYQNSGTYFRVGGEVNLLMKDPDRNMFFVGLRYGHSNFSETATMLVSDPYFGAIQKQLNNSSVQASWGELTAGLRVRIWKEFWMGYTARMKFLPSVSGDNELKTYDIPGYGLNGKGFYWGFNYQIFWRVPWTKQKKPSATFPK